MLVSHYRHQLQNSQPIRWQRSYDSSKTRNDSEGCGEVDEWRQAAALLVSRNQEPLQREGPRWSSLFRGFEKNMERNTLDRFWGEFQMSENKNI